VLLDEGAPDSVGRVFAQRGHTVIYHREVLPQGAPDEVVCAAALTNDAILIAVDGDMKRLAKRYGTTPALLGSVLFGSAVTARCRRSEWIKP
jgi:predicted nuclease of predicted toxin-antitoxin system